LAAEVLLLPTRRTKHRNIIVAKDLPVPTLRMRSFDVAGQIVNEQGVFGYPNQQRTGRP